MGSFSASAVLTGGYVLRHYRDRDHTGTETTAAVITDVTIGSFAAGSALDDVLTNLWGRAPGSYSAGSYADPSGDRQRHRREDDHSGTDVTGDIELSAAIGRYPIGTTLSEILVDLDARLSALP